MNSYFIKQIDHFILFLTIVSNSTNFLGEMVSLAGSYLHLGSLKSEVKTCWSCWPNSWNDNST